MKYFLLVLLVLAVLGGGIGYKMYNKPHEDLNTSNADFRLAPDVLFTEFEADETIANTKYLDKTIELKGTIKSIELNSNSIYLATGNEMYSIKCEFEDNSGVKNNTVGSIVKVRGVCSGLLMDVVLNRCVIIE